MKTNRRYRFLIAVILIILVSAGCAAASGEEIKAAIGYRASVNGFVVPMALYDAGGVYAVWPTAEVQVSYAYGSAPILFSGSSALFYGDRDNLVRVEETPVVGGVYKFFAELYIDDDADPADGAVDFTQLSSRSIHVFLDGFDVECVDIQLCSGERVGREITFLATKRYDAAVRGVKATVELYNATPNYAVGRRGAVQAEYQYGDAPVVMSGSAVLFTVEPREHVMQMPAVGDTVTFSMEVYNPDPDNTTIDFSMLSTRGVQITMNGWGVECVRVEPAKDGKAGVLLTFRAQKWYSAAVSGVRAKYRVINAYPGYATVQDSEFEFSFFYGSSGNIELNGSTEIYLEGEKYTHLEKEPEPGKTYISWVTILYKDGTDVYDVDFSQITPDNVEILIDGYTVTLIDTEMEYVEDEPRLQLNLRLVRNDRTVGDADGNRKLDIRDALRILQYLRRQKVPEEINLTNADVNGDGLADLQDARVILQAVSGWDVVLK